MVLFDVDDGDYDSDGDGGDEWWWWLWQWRWRWWWMMMVYCQVSWGAETNWWGNSTAQQGKRIRCEISLPLTNKHRQ